MIPLLKNCLQERDWKGHLVTLRLGWARAEHNPARRKQGAIQAALVTAWGPDPGQGCSSLHPCALGSEFYT